MAAYFRTFQQFSDPGLASESGRLGTESVHHSLGYSHNSLYRRPEPRRLARLSAGRYEPRRQDRYRDDLWRLVPGLYAEATLTFDETPRAIAVPVQAVDHEGANTNVIVVTDSGQVEVRKVELGVQTANYAQVVRGLHPGDEVVVLPANKDAKAASDREAPAQKPPGAAT